MKKILKKIREITRAAPVETALALGLVIVILVTYRAWLFGFGIMTKGDWGTLFVETMATLHVNYFHLWLSDYSFGRILLDVGQAPTYSLFGILAKLFGASHAISERLIYFWPVILFTPLGIWLLLKDLVKTPWARFVGVVVYSFNTYILILQGGHLTLSGAWAFAPIAIFFFRRTLLKFSMTNAIWAGLALAVCSAYEPRALYIILWVLLLYTLYEGIFVLLRPGEKAKKALSAIKLAGSAVVPVVILLLIDIFWLLGLGSIRGPIGGGIIANELWGSGFYNIKEALTLFQPFWQSPIPFTVSEIPFYFWAIPVLAFGGMYLNRRRREIAFFGLIALLGILLTKQVDAPFESVYQWLFSHLPGFNAFREASKFYSLIAIGYAVLIASLIDWLFINWNSTLARRISTYSVTAIAAAIFLSNLAPFVNGPSGVLFKARHVPADYEVVKDFLLNDSVFSRVYWLPLAPRWGFFSELHPKVADASDVFKNNSTQVLPKKEIAGAIFRQPYANEYFDLGSIKYVTVPLRDKANDDDFYQEDDPSRYKKLLDNIDWLKPLSIGTKDVAIYENQNPNPHVFALTNIFNFGSLENLKDKYRFITQTLGSKFSFSSPGSAAPSASLADVFESLKQDSIQNGEVTMPVDEQSGNIYINTNKAQFSYGVTNNVVTFNQQAHTGLLADDEPIGPQSQTDKPAGSVILRADSEYMIGIGEEIWPITTPTQPVRSLGVVDAPPVIYGVSPSNRALNPRLESGLWADKVEDCTPYEGSPVGEMNLVDDETRLSKVLELKASRHAACTGPAPVAVRAGERLLIQFEYRVKQGPEAGYQLVWNDPKKTVTQKYLPVNGDDWRTLRHIATVPAGATQVRLLLEAFPNDRKPIQGIAKYADVRIAGLSEASRVPTSLKPTYAVVPLKAGTKNLSVRDSQAQSKNLIPNPSLEDGLWQKKVGDCNANDDKASLGMSLNKNNKTDGAQALQLEAKRHIACTGPAKIDVREGHSYLLSFDYQSPNSKTAGYSVGFNNPDRDRISDTALPIKDAKWQSFNKTFTVPYGTTEASLSLYAYSEEDPSTKNVINRYDNFRLVEIPDVQDQYYLVSDPGQKLQAPGKVDFTLANPTKKLVHIKDAKTPFYLSMSEAYHPQWRLELNNGQVQGIGSWVPWAKPNAVAADEHFKLNDFLNGWYVDPAKLCEGGLAGCVKHADGSYDLELVAEFTPQRWFYVGGIISGATLIACLAYLGFIWRKRRRRTVAPAKAAPRHTPAPAATPRPQPKPAEAATGTIDLSQSDAAPAAPRRRQPLDPATAAKRDVKRPPRRRL